MILKDMLIMKKYSYNMDECNENDSSLYLCHDPCPLTYTKREDRLNKCGGLVSVLQLTHPPSSLSHTLHLAGLIRQVFEHPILAHYLGLCLLFSHKLQDRYCFQQLKVY